MELKIGDVVYLNSDVDLKNLMTINDTSREGRDFWECIWFVNGEIKLYNFHKDSLTKK